MNESSKDLSISIRSRYEDVSLLGICVRSLATHAGFSEIQSGEIELAIVEGANNCIEHAYSDEENHYILMRILMNTALIQIDLIDEGSPPDDNLLIDAKMDFTDLPEDIDFIADSGRGVTLMLTLMDQVQSFRENDHNVLRLIKNLV